MGGYPQKRDLRFVGISPLPAQNSRYPPAQDSTQPLVSRAFFGLRGRWEGPAGARYGVQEPRSGVRGSSWCWLAGDRLAGTIVRRNAPGGLGLPRRAERCIGLAIRKGQKEGRIQRRGNRDIRTADIATVTGGVSLHEVSRASYPLTDDVSPEQFEKAIGEAKAERNLSRANVVTPGRRDPGAPVTTWWLSHQVHAGGVRRAGRDPGAPARSPRCGRGCC